jgi:Protein of unknown function (DUF1638)
MTNLSSVWPFHPKMSIGIVACGALATHIDAIVKEQSLDVTIYPLPPLLHNHPEKIAGEVDLLLTKISGSHSKCAVAYADCGTYGALDVVLQEHKVSRLGGNHCYDIFAGKEVIEKLMAENAGTYFLTDYLVKSFNRSVIVELGLDRRPELRDDYFKNYSKVIWLAQSPTPDLEIAANAAADLLGLPLEIRKVGEIGLTREILALVAD